MQRAADRKQESQVKSSRVSAPLRQSRAPPPSSPSPRKEMASITDIGHVHVLSPSGPRFRRVCRVVVIMEVVQLSSSCAPPTSNPHQCVCCVYFYHPDRCRGSCRIKRSAETTKQNPSEPWRDSCLSWQRCRKRLVAGNGEKRRSTDLPIFCRSSSWRVGANLNDMWCCCVVVVVEIANHNFHNSPPPSFIHHGITDTLQRSSRPQEPQIWEPKPCHHNGKPNQRSPLEGQSRQSSISAATPRLWFRQ